MAKEKNAPDPKASTEREFLEAVGRAVVEWQSVEVVSSGLFFILLQARNQAGASALFWRIGNFAMRIEMLDIAAKYLFAPSKRPDELPKRWDGLRARLYSASDLRNRIAHSEIGEEDSGRRTAFKLRAPLLDWSRVDPANLEKGARAMKVREVDYVKLKGAGLLFTELCRDLVYFRMDVEKLKITARAVKIGRR